MGVLLGRREDLSSCKVEECARSVRADRLMTRKKKSEKTSTDNDNTFLGLQPVVICPIVVLLLVFISYSRQVQVISPLHRGRLRFIGFGLLVS